MPALSSSRAAPIPSLRLPHLPWLLGGPPGDTSGFPLTGREPRPEFLHFLFSVCWADSDVAFYVSSISLERYGSLYAGDVAHFYFGGCGGGHGIFFAVTSLKSPRRRQGLKERLFARLGLRGHPWHITLSPGLFLRRGWNELVSKAAPSLGSLDL